ncbi:unnamed protein product [Sphenostylis stenocarpa]|uniref:Uncharacterized protein n=1 Tax=Sphenostylis stenocarpa TaxID=92480 RepID=A0AA86T473_9FABA|nr:unnamed protein product [Sphenostylis stenocarpa]
MAKAKLLSFLETWNHCFEWFVQDKKRKLPEATRPRANKPNRKASEKQLLELPNICNSTLKELLPSKFTNRQFPQHGNIIWYNQSRSSAPALIKIYSS